MDNLPIFDEVVVMFGNYEHFYMLMNNSGLSYKTAVNVIDMHICGGFS